MDIPLKINIQDLMNIHSLAVSNYLDLPYNSSIHKDSKELMAFCWTKAVTTWLSSKDILTVQLEINNGTKGE